MPPRSVEIIGPVNTPTWNDPLLTKGYGSKPDVNTWNKMDLRHYVGRKYRDQFAQSLPMAPAQANQTFTSIEFTYEKQTGQNCTPAVIADYIDFFFDRHINAVIQKEGQFGIFKLSRPKFILDYIQSRNVSQQKVSQQQPAPQKQMVVPTETEEATLENLTAAFKINPRYFVSNYGIILPVNYLMYAKKKSKEEAVQYVVTAVAKLAGNIEPVVSATNQYAPYPNWFEFLDAGQIIKGLKVTTSNEPLRYGFLKGA